MECQESPDHSSALLSASVWDFTVHSYSVSTAPQSTTVHHTTDSRPPHGPTAVQCPAHLSSVSPLHYFTVRSPTTPVPLHRSDAADSHPTGPVLHSSAVCQSVNLSVCLYICPRIERLLHQSTETGCSGPRCQPPWRRSRGAVLTCPENEIHRRQ